MEIAPDIYQIKVPIPNNPLGNLNCYLVRGKDGWLMIDTGWYTGEAYNSLKSALGEMGLDFTSISTIVITHSHPDRFGLVGRIKQVSPGTRVFAHRWEFDLIGARFLRNFEFQDKLALLLKRHGVPDASLKALVAASAIVLNNFVIMMPDEALYGGEIISTGIFDLEVIWTPGHSPGHICLYEPKNRLLFCGDHILPVVTPNISYSIMSGDNPLGDYINALHKLQNLMVTRVFPGHQQIFWDLKGRIKQIIDHHEDRMAEIQKALSGGEQSAWKISQYVTWDIPEQNWDEFSPRNQRSALTEVIAHLEYMRWIGKVQRTVDSSIIVYSNHAIQNRGHKPRGVRIIKERGY